MVGSSTEDFRDAQVRITPIASQSGLFGGRRKTYALGLVTRPTALQSDSLSPIRTDDVELGNDESAIREVMVAPSAIMSIVDLLARDTIFANASRPSNAALSVIVLRPFGERRLVSEVFIDARHAGRFASLVTDATIGSRSFETARQWELTLPRNRSSAPR